MIRCLIVDDEPFAREILVNYCSHLPELQVVAACTSALEAKTVLEQKQADVLFLDINMPLLSGLSFVKTLKSRPEVIFTTAYKEYATDAFDLDACDYLLKPFSLERFIIAVDKAIAKLHPHGRVAESHTPVSGYLFIRTAGQIYKVRHDELLYAEAAGNHVKLVTQGGTLLPLMSFAQLAEMLPAVLFKRIHRSFIVNESKINRIQGNRVFVGETELPIGAGYREGFLKELGLGN